MVEHQQKGQPVSQPKPAIPEAPYRTDGTRLFRLVNFELFARPTPRMRLLSIAGSGLFVGIMGYFTWSSHQAQKQKALQRRR
jgi:hypothetical protein